MSPARVLAVVMVLSLAACGGAVGVEDSGFDASPGTDSGTQDGGSADAGGPDAGTPDSGAPDSGTPDGGGGDGGVTVAVSHTREFRGMWVATVSNLDFPASVAGNRDAGIAELGRIVDVAAAHGINALVFQVRPEADALYQSSREPWSRFLTGTQGRDPGYDPLGELITLAHARAIEVHAWVNPYRAKVSSGSAVAATHISQVLSQHAINYGTATVMDPSAPAVRTWVISEIADMVRDYDVDGVHFDDYFYPYPVSGTPFPDNQQYAAYQADGGTMTRLAWRRENVNQLVQGVSQAVAARKPHVRFGISPFGIYRPGMPPGITGLNSYDDISCDTLAWLSNGWLDYLAPQLYWPTTQSGQEFDLLIAWWAQQVSNGQSIFAGHALFRLGSTGAWTLQELRDQVALTRAQYPNAAGSIWFRHANLRDNLGGVQTVFDTDFYPRPALPPPVAKLRMATVAAPSAQVNGAAVALSHPAPSELRAFTIYKRELGLWRLQRVVPAQPGAVTLASGQWAIAAVNRADVESRAVVVDVP
ncbi:MAG: family 10 glycosylhydrolase [Myxococcales bacterium]|nr:family 10 glycosylhydrolase [Myxococcales bacterium]